MHSGMHRAIAISSLPAQWRMPCRDAKFCVSRATNSAMTGIFRLSLLCILACETQDFASLLWWEADIMIGFLLIYLMAAGRDGNE